MLDALLQDAVDREFQNVGSMPEAGTLGMNNGNEEFRDGNGHSICRAVFSGVSSSPF